MLVFTDACIHTSMYSYSYMSTGQLFRPIGANQRRDVVKRTW